MMFKATRKLKLLTSISMFLTLVSIGCTASSQREYVKTNGAPKLIGGEQIPTLKTSKEEGNKECLNLKKLTSEQLRKTNKGHRNQIIQSDLAWTNGNMPWITLKKDALTRTSDAKTTSALFKESTLFAGIGDPGQHSEELVSQFLNDHLKLRILDQKDCSEIITESAENLDIIEFTNQSLLLRQNENQYLKIDLIFTNDRGALLRIRTATKSELIVCEDKTPKTGVVFAEYVITSSTPKAESFLLQPAFVASVQSLVEGGSEKIAPKLNEENDEALMQKLSKAPKQKQTRMSEKSLKEILELPFKLNGNLDSTDVPKKKKLADMCK
jgi:hypothetical protein